MISSRFNINSSPVIILDKFQIVSKYPPVLYLFF